MKPAATARGLASLGLLALVYFAAARLGLRLAYLNPSTTPYVRGSSAKMFVNRPDEASVTYIPVMLSSSIRL